MLFSCQLMMDSRDANPDHLHLFIAVLTVADVMADSEEECPDAAA